MATTGTHSTRRWTTALRFPDGSLLYLEPPSQDLANYEGDLLAAATRSAVRQAAALIGDDDVYGYSVVIYKTTKARGTAFDRSYNLEREHGGQIVGRR